MTYTLIAITAVLLLVVGVAALIAGCLAMASWQAEAERLTGENE